MRTHQSKVITRGKPVHPSVCTHHGGMIFDDDFCCCKHCEQQWFLGDRGWVPLVNGRPYVERPQQWNRKAPR